MLKVQKQVCVCVCSGPYRPVGAESGEYLYCPAERWLNNLHVSHSHGCSSWQHYMSVSTWTGRQKPLLAKILQYCHKEDLSLCWLCVIHRTKPSRRNAAQRVCFYLACRVLVRFIQRASLNKATAPPPWAGCVRGQKRLDREGECSQHSKTTLFPVNRCVNNYESLPQ